MMMNFKLFIVLLVFVLSSCESISLLESVNVVDNNYRRLEASDVLNSLVNIVMSMKRPHSFSEKQNENDDKDILGIPYSDANRLSEDFSVLGYNNSSTSSTEAFGSIKDNNPLSNSLDSLLSFEDLSSPANSDDDDNDTLGIKKNSSSFLEMCPLDPTMCYDNEWDKIHGSVSKQERESGVKKNTSKFKISNKKNVVEKTNKTKKGLGYKKGVSEKKKELKEKKKVQRKDKIEKEFDRGDKKVDDVKKKLGKKKITKQEYVKARTEEEDAANKVKQAKIEKNKKDGKLTKVDEFKQHEAKVEYSAKSKESSSASASKSASSKPTKKPKKSSESSSRSNSSSLTSSTSTGSSSKSSSSTPTKKYQKSSSSDGSSRSISSSNISSVSSSSSSESLSSTPTKKPKKSSESSSRSNSLSLTSSTSTGSSSKSSSSTPTKKYQKSSSSDGSSGSISSSLISSVSSSSSSESISLEGSSSSKSASESSMSYSSGSSSSSSECPCICIQLDNERARCKGGNVSPQRDMSILDAVTNQCIIVPMEAYNLCKTVPNVTGNNGQKIALCGPNPKRNILNKDMFPVSFKHDNDLSIARFGFNRSNSNIHPLSESDKGKVTKCGKPKADPVAIDLPKQARVNECKQINQGPITRKPSKNEIFCSCICTIFGETKSICVGGDFPNETTVPFSTVQSKNCLIYNSLRDNMECVAFGRSPYVLCDVALTNYSDMSGKPLCQRLKILASSAKSLNISVVLEPNEPPSELSDSNLTCKITNNGACHNGYSGSNCSSKSCPKNCNGNNGSCNTATGVCRCNNGFSGSDCSLASSSRCSNNGIYIDASKSCTCNRGWRGDDCSKKSCTRNCNWNGTCNDDGTCSCKEGFSGSSCSDKTCKNNCSGNGTCNTSTGKCTCNAGFRSDDCSKKSCRNSCSMNGTCNDDGTCSCKEGFSGTSCSEKVCKNNCSGNGTCDTSTGVCSCKDGYRGGDCSTKTGDWTSSEFSLCNKACGGGIRTRTVTCRINGRDSADASKCDGDNKPAASQECNQGACGTWKTTSWSECSLQCGGGSQRRRVDCKVGEEAVTDSRCAGAKPVAFQTCNTAACVKNSNCKGSWKGSKCDVNGCPTGQGINVNGECQCGSNQKWNDAKTECVCASPRFRGSDCSLCKGKWYGSGCRRCLCRASRNERCNENGECIVSLAIIAEDSDEEEEDGNDLSLIYA